MGNKNKLKEAFEVENIHSAFFTGGSVEWTADGEELLCQKVTSIEVLNIALGTITSSVGSSGNEEDTEDDAIYTFTLSLNNETIVTAHKSGLLKLWSKTNSCLMKVWKSIHKGPIARLSLNSSGDVLASGGSDSNIRLWDLVHQVCTVSLKGAQGVVSVLSFHPDTQKDIIFGAADDAKIHAWDTKTGKRVMFLSGHFTKVTSLSFSEDCLYMVSSGRDKVVILWDLLSGSLIRTVPVYEGVEGAVILPVKFAIPGFKKNKSDDGLYVATAGEKGIVRVWEMRKGKEIYSQSNSLVNPSSEEGGLSITQLLYNKVTNTLALVTVDHNIILHDLETFNCTKQMVGFSDEILDVVFIGTNDSYLAVATNSIDIKLYETSTMNCQLLKGHTDLVLALAKAPTNTNLLISSSKDSSVRLWLMNQDVKTVRCIAVGIRHTASVGSVAFSQMSTEFCVSVSQDTCLKVWEVPMKFNDNEEVKLQCTYTEIAHQKDINCVTVSPNDKIIATGSQDKTAKLWSASGLSLIGVFRGHRRGVWSVRFSPVDQVLLTTSADCTIKLWSLTDLTCIKTFEGHDSSVLRAEFLTKGMQIISAGADGLIKLWSIKSSECVTTLDKHDGRIWTLTVSSDENIVVSGGSDSMLIKWKDVTLEKRDREAKEREQLALQEQTLTNLVHNNQLLKALKLAIKLDRPMQALKVINAVIKTADKVGLQSTVKQLKNDQKESLLQYATQWNSNSRNCHAAQLVINVMLAELQTGDFRPVGYASLLEGALPYTERHYRRLTQLLQDVHFISYTVNCMQPHAKSLEG